MNETEKNMDNYIKELLTINEDINKQLQSYKDKEDKLRELINNYIHDDFGELSLESI